MNARLKLSLFALGVWAFQASAAACSVCATGKESARGFYYMSTAFLSLAPLAMFGGLAYYVVKKHRQ